LKTFGAHHFFSLIAPVATLALLGAQSAHAQSSTWLNTGTTSAYWNNPDNWIGGTVPGNTSAGTTGTASDTATFNTAIGANGYGSSTTPVLIDLGRTIGSITFSSSAVNYFIGTTAGNPLYLSATGTISNTTTSGTETINAPLVLEGSYTFSSTSASSVTNFGGTIQSGAATGTQTLTVSDSAAQRNSANFNLSGNISDGTGKVAVLLTGNGVSVFSGNSSYSGGTTLTGGNTLAGSNSAFGTGTITLNGGDFGASTSGITLGNALFINSGVTAYLAPGNSSPYDANGLTFTGGLSQGGSQTLDNEGNSGVAISFTTGAINIDSAAGTSNSLTLSNRYGNSGSIFNISSVIQDFASASTKSGSLIIGTGDGNGTILYVNLSGANTYSGGTSITNSSVVQLSGAGTLGAATNALADSSSLDLNGTNQEVGDLTGTGTIYNSNATTTSTLTAGDGDLAATSSSFTGTIKDNTGTGGGVALAKTGAGTLALSGTNTYTGGTTISQGTLQAGSAAALGKGNVTVSGGTLQGTVTNVNMAANLSVTGGVIDTEATGTGKFTLTGSTSAFAISSGTWDLDITGSGNDLITSTGGALTSFTITGGTLDLTGDTLTVGDTYTILSGFGTGSGQFSSITGYNTSLYDVTFDDTSTLGVGVLDVTAGSAPEPSTWAMLLGGVALLVGIQRRRRSVRI
jgi:fibronectin-binding autotransporter adhesin